MTQWTWAKDGKSVEVAGKKYEVRAESPGEFAEFMDFYEEATWIFSRLYGADQSFRLGQADYAGAVDNLRDLYAQTGKASRLLSDRTNAISNFFSPAKISEALQGLQDEKSLALFIKEAIVILGEASAPKARAPNAQTASGGPDEESK